MALIDLLILLGIAAVVLGYACLTISSLADDEIPAAPTARPQPHQEPQESHATSTR